MKKILRKTTPKYRAKCHYCDCEFEYEPNDIFYDNVITGAAVSCPNCHNWLDHNYSLKSNIITERL